MHHRLGIFLATLFSAIGTAHASQETTQADLAPPAPETPCAQTYLTGVGGPPPHLGKAQSGVFFQYGTIGNGCDSVRLQFDAGRGTLLRLSQIRTKKRPGFVTPQSLDAMFITHAHSDHTSALPDIISTRWVLSKNDGQFTGEAQPPGKYAPLPVICSGIACKVVRRATTMWDNNEIPLRKKTD